MLFQQTITRLGDYQFGTVKAVITFTADTWMGAGRHGDQVLKALGMEGPMYSSVITYARPEKPKPLNEVMDDVEAEQEFERVNGPKPAGIDINVGG